MAFLESDARNISSGWGPEPKLEAPSIGSTLAAILENKYRQQKLTQDTLSEAIKAQQARNQDAAFAQALQNTGLTEGQDVSGLSGAQMARMTQLLADRTPDTQKDAYLAAMTSLANARATGTGTGDGGSGGPEIVEKDGIKYLVNRTSKSVTYHRLPGQGGPKLTPTEQGWAAPEIPGLTVYPDNTADPLAPDTPAAPDTGQAPDPSVSPTPPPSDTAAGHAPTYGVAPSRDAAKPGQSYMAPDGSIRVKGNN